jgi:flagellin
MKTAEGAVGNTVEILRALKEKAINAANDSNTDEDRQTIQKEINQFIDQIDDNALVQFNGKYLIDGSKNNAMYETKTILLNQSLDKATSMTSALTALNNRAGDSLGIQETDKYQVSWVQNGTIHFTSGNVSDLENLGQLLGMATGTEHTATDSTGLISTSRVAPVESTDTTPAAYDISADTDNYEPASKTSIINGSVCEQVSNQYNSYLSFTAADPSAAIAEAETEAKDAAADDAMAILDGLNKDDGTALTKDDLLALADGESITITGYYMQPTDADATEAAQVTINIGLAVSSSGSTATDKTTATYTVLVNGENTGDDTINLYQPVTPTETDGPFTDAYDKFGKAVYTPDKTEGVAVTSKEPGVKNQLSGLTICILDQDGNVKKAANAALDQFKQYQRAENQTGDMALNFHIGSEANVAIKVGMGDMRSEALGLKGSDGQRIDVFTKEHANAAINVIENALTKALDQQTTIGAIEARLEYTATNLTTSSENVQAAESTIRDADMAKEMTAYTKNNVLMQAAQAMLAQANQNSSAVLSLLQ